MKTFKFLLAALSIVSLVSCQRDTDDTQLSPEEGTTKMLIQYTIYEFGVPYEYYDRYYIDTVANILYRTYDTVNGDGFRNIYDANDRLVRSVYRDLGSDTDSLVITRPSANTIVFESFGGVNDIITAITTDIGSGRKRVRLEKENPSSGTDIIDYYMAADGTMDSSVAKSYNSFDEVYLIERRKVNYNANRVATSIVDVSENTSDEIYVYTRTITRDNNNDTYLDAYIKSRWGSDLGWLNYTSNGIFHLETDELFGDDYVQDVYTLTGGTMLSYNTNLKIYNKYTGVLVDDSDIILVEFVPAYYPNNRLKSVQGKENGDLELEMDLKYYN